MTSSISSMTYRLVVPFYCGVLDNDRPEQCCCFVDWLTAGVPWLGHAISVSSFLHRTLRKVCTSQHRPRSIAGISLGLGKICCGRSCRAPHFSSCHAPHFSSPHLYFLIILTYTRTLHTTHDLTPVPPPHLASYSSSSLS